MGIYLDRSLGLCALKSEGIKNHRRPRWREKLVTQRIKGMTNHGVQQILYDTIKELKPLENILSGPGDCTSANPNGEDISPFH